MDAVRHLADTVLYEGYVLWPYRRSALKNQKRWTFGGVFPSAHTREHPDDRAAIQVQCLLEAPDDAAVEIGLRFLQVVERRIRDATGAFVDELVVDGVRHLAWEEAIEREVPARLHVGEGGAATPVAIAAGTQEETLAEGAALVRSWRRLDGRIDVRAEPIDEGLNRLTVCVTNATAWDGTDREDALRSAFCSTHVVLRTDDGAFVSVIDPPDELRQAAGECVNEGVWPVLVGEEGDRRVVLAAPIILSDHPQIAPESPGDLFDAGEIDRLLILNVLSLGEDERAEARASDPRVAEIIDRCAGLGPAELLPLHGVIRDFRPAAPE